MKHIKIDLMTVLFVVVIIGVVVTMSTQASTQASDRSLVGSEVLQVSAQSNSTALPTRR
jgi:hypothetical protein